MEIILDCMNCKESYAKTNSVFLDGELADEIGIDLIAGFKITSDVRPYLNSIPEYSEIRCGEITSLRSDKIKNGKYFKPEIRLDGGFYIHIDGCTRPVIGLFRSSIRLVKMNDELLKRYVNKSNSPIYQKDYLIPYVKGLIVYADNHQDVVNAAIRFANI